MIREYLSQKLCVKNCAILCDICVNLAISKIVVEYLGEEPPPKYEGIFTVCGVENCVASDGCLGSCDAMRRFELREELQKERREILGIPEDFDEGLPL